MQNLWTWGGKYFGYRSNDLLITHKGVCAGQFSGQNVFDRKGRYLGELKNNYRLITNKSKKSLRGGMAPRFKYAATAPYVNYVGYVMYAGYEDFPEASNFS